MYYSRKSLIDLNQVYTFQSNRIKLKKSEIFTTFDKIHRSFLSNLKFEETKSQIKARLFYLANSYFHNCKPSSRKLHQHRILRNFRKNEDIIITKPDKKGKELSS